MLQESVEKTNRFEEIKDGTFFNRFYRAATRLSGFRRVEPKTQVVYVLELCTHVSAHVSYGCICNTQSRLAALNGV